MSKVSDHSKNSVLVKHSSVQGISLYSGQLYKYFFYLIFNILFLKAVQSLHV